jgi:protein-glucosylgalactosylhydroxylysine glucosidase
MKSQTITTYDAERPMAYVANGLVGLTVPQTPLVGGVARLSGCYERSEEYGSEYLAALPYPLGLHCTLDGEQLEGHANAFRTQTYDFSSGELSTKLVYSIQDVTISVSSILFCSRSMPTVAIQKTSFSASRPCCLVADCRPLAGEARGILRQKPANLPEIDWVAL